MRNATMLLFGACFLFACAHLEVEEKLMSKDVSGRSLYPVDTSEVTSNLLFLQVRDWQEREVESRRTQDVASGPHSYLFRDEYNNFSRSARRALANQTVIWAQDLSKKYYREEAGEFFSSLGDDCDGLELLIYTFLLSHGFARETVYRAVLGNMEKDYLHMVTLWFEDDSGDPWVLDPTGTAAPKKSRRLSGLPEWRVLIMFNEEISYAPSYPVF